MALICLLFMGLLHVSEIFAAREILNHAAARGARAKTVGFNLWMVEKSVRVAAIPNAGKLTTPSIDGEDAELRKLIETENLGEMWMNAVHATPSSRQYAIERARIPEYMGSYNKTRTSYILDYEHWGSIEIPRVSVLPPAEGSTTPMITVKTRQEYPIWVPLRRVFFPAETIELSGVSTIESHYELYIDDQEL